MSSKEEQECSVYIMTNLSVPNAVRIGESRTPVIRPRQLRCGSPYPYITVHKVTFTSKSKAQEIEKTVHNHFAAEEKRLDFGGSMDWFSISPSKGLKIIIWYARSKGYAIVPKAKKKKKRKRTLSSEAPFPESLFQNLKYVIDSNRLPIIGTSPRKNFPLFQAAANRDHGPRGWGRDIHLFLGEHPDYDWRTDCLVTNHRDFLDKFDEEKLGKMSSFAFSIKRKKRIKNSRLTNIPKELVVISSLSDINELRTRKKRRIQSDEEQKEACDCGQCEDCCSK